MYSKPQLLEAVEQEAEVNGLKAFENIVDKDGHKRFIEGDITLETITGVTKTYGKWALSGSHLLVVLGIDIANATTLAASAKICNLNFPQWIKDKIFALWGNSYVESLNFIMWGDDWTTQTLRVNFVKLTEDTIYLSNAGNVTLTADRHCRIAFDLLIDNE